MIQWKGDTYVSERAPFITADPARWRRWTILVDGVFVGFAADVQAIERAARFLRRPGR